MKERLQKILSVRGIASRRHAEQFIEAGRVTVNGKKAVLGQQADPSVDDIRVDGVAVKGEVSYVYYLYNKPLGVVVTNAPQATSSSKTLQRDNTEPRKMTLAEALPSHLRGRVFPVGRLDKDTMGLLLLTNDGELALRLTHPRYDHEKEYEVKLDAPISNGALDKLQKGVSIDGEKTKPAGIQRLSDSSFLITITEGRNRQIRRMCQKVGSYVKDLRRVRIVTLRDAHLPIGAIRPLTDGELLAIRAAVGL